MLQILATLLLDLVLLCPLGMMAAQPLVKIENDFYHRNTLTNPNTVEIPLNKPWKFVCQWSSRNGSSGGLAFQAPNQDVLQHNCQFKDTSGPAGCTPSNIEYATNSMVKQRSNVSCHEIGTTLICSIEFVSFNSRHIGHWACVSGSHRDVIYLQYFKLLPQSDLVLASYDIVSPEVTRTNGSNNTANRFECFTKTSVIPPAKIAFLLGGHELTENSTKYPVEFLSETTYTSEPSMYTANASGLLLSTPTSDLAMNQRILSSNRVLHIKLKRRYNGLILECVVNQNLTLAHRVASQSMVLHLDDNPNKKSASNEAQFFQRLVCLLVAMAATLASVVV